jgi:hypothetical protein
LGGRFDGKLFSQVLADLVDTAPIPKAVRAGELYMFKDA